MNLNVDANSADEAVIVMTRMFDAPREKVWAAFTDPRHVAKWYGGHGFTNPVCEMDVRPGGIWRHVMCTPDGVELKLEFVFLEVVTPEKLSWQNTAHGKPKPPGAPPTSRMTVTLEEAGEKTKWKLVTRFDTFADRDSALRSDFSKYLSEGSEKLNEIARSL